MIPKTLTETVERLSASSRSTAKDVYGLVMWPEVIDPSETWFSSPELISIAGTTQWKELDESAQHRLSFWEAVNFFSLNIHGERALMEGLAARLYLPEQLGIAPYLHHFLAEENQHSVLFGTFCVRYAGKVYPDRKVVRVGSDASQNPPGLADLLFFSKVLIFEEIVDGFNVIMGGDSRIHAVARVINHNHHAEEARHLVFGRLMVEDLAARHIPSWTADSVTELQEHLAQYMIATWREFVNPDMYRDAGFADPYATMDMAWDAGRARRIAMSTHVVDFLVDTGLLASVPAL